MVCPLVVSNPHYFLTEQQIHVHKKKIVPPEDQLFHFLDDSMVETWSVMTNLGMCIAGDLFCTFTQCYPASSLIRYHIALY